MKEYEKMIRLWKEENKDLIKSNKCRKVFLECLPKWKKGEGNGHAGSINWNKSINHKVYFIYEDIQDYLLIKYFDGKYIYITYNDINKFKMLYSNLYDCQLGNFLKKRTSDFKIQIGTRFQDTKRDITIIDRGIISRYNKDGSFKCNEKYYKYKCNKCGFGCKKHWSILDKKYKDELWVVESSLLKGRKAGCGCCCSSPNIIVENINSIYKTDPWMIPYIGEECAKTHTNRSHDKVQVTCPDCGRKSKKQIAIYNIYKNDGFGCICGDGIKYPNKFMFNLLEQLAVDFETEYSPEWIKPKLYDFYIPLMNVVIEMDGGLGHGNDTLDKRTARETLEIDNYKDEQARLHGLEVIRINCDYKHKDRLEYIKENIIHDNKLNKLFELFMIDWNKCEEFALSNRAKEACDYWNNGIYSTKEISKIMKIARGTIINYLNQGRTISWTNYDSKEEILKGSSYSGKLKRKQILMLTFDYEPIGLFSSSKEIEDNSVKLFGIKLNYGNICAVARGDKKAYKNYYFKYIENLTQEEYSLYDIENKLKELNKSNREILTNDNNYGEYLYDIL